MEPLNDGERSIEVKGKISRSEVRSEFLRYESDIRYCYERKLVTRPNLKGKLVMKWMVDEEGRTRDINVLDSEINDKSVHSCLQSVIRKMSFNTSQAKDQVIISYPLEFVSTQL